VTPPNGLLSERYELVREVGRGGMAVVYLAVDRKHDRQVAVKILRPELTTSLGADRFLREIAIVAKLTHPHILPLYDSGNSDDSLFYVMPFVEGETLRDRLGRETQLPLADATRIAREIAGGLSYAHSFGIVHRDIKPENILLSTGLAVIADFGIARALSAAGADNLTGTGLGIGTPKYMSPEQCAGDEVDGRSDVYALGCLFYEMLVGEPPFSGPNVQAILARHTLATIPRVQTVRGGVPAQVDDVISRALAKIPADRFATALEFAEVLDDALAAPDSPAARTGVVPSTHRNSIAVLPFVNMSGDPDNEFLSDGISEEIIQSLTKVSDIHVIARTSAFSFKGRPEDVRTIGEKLNVGSILEGSVKRAGNRLRINAQLVNVSDAFELWSERFDRQLTDVFEVMDSIAGAIVEALQVELLDDRRLFAAGTEDFDAYEFYLRGRFHWNKRTPSDLQQSVEMMESAIALDPAFALANAGLADAYTIMGIYGMRSPLEVMPLAKQAGERALAIEPGNAEALTSVACGLAMFDWDWKTAERYFTTAILANPKYPTAHQWYAINCLAPQKRFVDAHNALRTAREIDPLSLVVHASRGLVYYYEGKYDRAQSEYDRVFEIDANFGMAYYFSGQAHERIGRYDDARDAFERALEIIGESPEIIAALGHLHAVADDRDLAQKRLARLMTLSETRHVSAALVAQVHAGLGEEDAAFEWLGKALQQHAPELAWLGVRPTFDVLRPSPKFENLLRKVRLQG